MGDVGEFWNAIRPTMKTASQKKRAGNREASAAILSRSAIPFESKNDGAHLIVECGKSRIDFWPGTGLWIVRGSRIKNRGVRKLVNYVKANNG